ncbi:MAG: hypothetical protein ABEK17_03830 [Candidatus Aenigmatarchaeota archaeon]
MSREDKLIITLEHFEGEKKTAKELLKWMSNRWAKTGFKGPKSLGLFLRRYRFDRDESKYIIEQEKIENRKDIDGEW